MTLDEFANMAVNVPFKDSGREWDGWDCWGLVRKYFKEVRNILLPSYDCSSMSEEAKSKLTSEVDRRDGWVEVQRGQEIAGDIVIIREGRLPSHIGIVLKPGRVLHVNAKAGTCVQKYNDPAVKHRIVAFGRYNSE